MAYTHRDLIDIGIYMWREGAKVREIVLKLFIEYIVF